ncbi:hypothetical protein EBS02_09370, partial [bacterium]|nr:hypothetical protein [bacterium]
AFAYATLIGIYQSLLFLCPIIMMLFFVCELSCQEKSKSIIELLVNLIVTIGVGGVLYFIIQKIFITAYPHSMEYINGYLPKDFLSITWFQRKYNTLIDIINTLCGRPKVWQTNNSCLIGSIAISILAIIFKMKNKGALKMLICSLLLLLTFAFPFSINLMRMMPMPLRTYDYTPCS